MDSGNGKFAQVSEPKFDELLSKDVSGLFREGEILEVRGSRFRVQSIKSRRLILKLLGRTSDNSES